MRHDVTFPLYVEVDEIYNLACPASPVHYQFDPVQTTKSTANSAASFAANIYNIIFDMPLIADGTFPGAYYSRPIFSTQQPGIFTFFSMTYPLKGATPDPVAAST